MRILMIAPQPFFEPRGTPISVHQRLTALSTLGHEVDLLTYPLGNDVDLPCVRIFRIPRVPFIKKVKIGPSWSKLLFDGLLFFKTVQMLMESKYDVIHAHEEAAYFSLTLAKVFQTHHLYDMHSNLPHQLKHSKYGKLRVPVYLFQLLSRWVIKASDAVLTIGTDLEEEVERLNPDIPHAMIENLAVHDDGNQDNTELMEKIKTDLQLGGRNLVVYTGSFEPYQGLDLLLDSALIVRKQEPDILFLLVGGNPDQVDEYRSKVRAKDLEKNVKFTGTVSPEEALAYMKLASVLVSPRVDGMSVPLKIYTYLLSGKLCVATRLHAHTQVLNDEIALLVEPTVEAFSSGVLKAVNDGELRERVGRQAQKFALEKYTFANYLTKMDQVYQTLEASSYPVKHSLPMLKE